MGKRRAKGGAGGAGAAVDVGLMLAGVFDGRGWQGPTLAGCLRGVTVQVALWRPGPGRKCIWEQVLHAAYWKYAVVGLLDWKAGERLGFERSPSNWPALSEAHDEKAWMRDVAYLKRMHAALIEVASQIGPGQIDSIPESRPGKNARKWTRGQYLAGIAAHDAYHCGQVQLLKRMARGQGGPREED